MRLKTAVCVTAVAVTAALSQVVSVTAAPPPARILAATVSLPPSSQWVNHEIVSGERLDEIAERYAVSVGSILRWNKLDPKRPLFWIGQQLRIQTQLPDRIRTKLTYSVHFGDTWTSIAEQYHVDPAVLRQRWNPQEKDLHVGHLVTVWLEPEATPPTLPTRAFDLAPVPEGAMSMGYPDAGRLWRGVLIPTNPLLYTIRNPEHGYGSSHAIRVLQESIASFRSETGYERPVLLWDMSTKQGGRFGPHRSHRTGRDIDIGLPLRADVTYTGFPSVDAVDWEATWLLVRSLIESDQVRYVFLSRPQQQALHKAAKGCGATREELERIIQYPRVERVGIVRHSPGHTGHLHVRFLCGSDEPDCQEF
jgi:murein endopeptidase/LysM repeat protein